MQKRILVSRCLLGDTVAYHGRKKKLFYNKFDLKSALFEEQEIRRRNHHHHHHHHHHHQKGSFELVPICPEVDLLHMPVPRRPVMILLDKDKDGACRRRLETAPPSRNRTRKAEEGQHYSFSKDQLEVAFVKNWLDQFESVDAFIGKRGSPSCAFYNARTYHTNHDDDDDDDDNDEVVALVEHSRKEQGVFVEHLKNRFPLVRITSEDNIKSRKHLKDFIDSIF